MNKLSTIFFLALVIVSAIALNQSLRIERLTKVQKETTKELWYWQRIEPIKCK